MKIFSIGCSFTEGQGLKRQTQESYTYKLGEKLKLKNFNFGLCGASNDYIFRKAFELINSNTITKDDIIIIQWTHYNRKELPILYKNKKWYLYPPPTYFPMQDKVIINRINSVQNEYWKPVENTNYDELHELKEKITKLLDDYILNFINDEYQKNTTINYINALYTYLEHYEYKHMHFFGWKDCIIDNICEDKLNFLKKTFGEFTNTIRNEHPDKEAHLNWSNYLYEKLKELNYI